MLFGSGLCRAYSICEAAAEPVNGTHGTKRSGNECSFVKDTGAAMKLSCEPQRI